MILLRQILWRFRELSVRWEYTITTDPLEVQRTICDGLILLRQILWRFRELSVRWNDIITTDPLEFQRAICEMEEYHYDRSSGGSEKYL
jgi:hypothetical protein